MLFCSGVSDGKKCFITYMNQFIRLCYSDRYHFYCYAECYYAERYYAECYYAESYYAECRGAVKRADKLNSVE